ncbi:glycosyltransferase [Nocardia sp. CDC159]|uniref:Glycosyltransferase n=1 Tax=Nocardia pulmonis TaxID=2951408 RepID=A0A9X2IXT6_9NOCA|nr:MULTISPECIES: glycosyltransferase [Nocardia]MCM6774984.1 glycosyltransferase [Nocardia pulmonis]MCM6789915.1 glycosyltransferase [Nocardia sp. CDC159]
MTRVGLIARADNTGLGVQTWEFHRHMRPTKTLVVAPASRAGRAEHPIFPARFPGATIVRGIPNTQHLEDFLDGVDVVFTAETPYNYTLFSLAAEVGVRTVLQYNFEFLDYLQRRDLPRPDVLADPARWHRNEVETHRPDLRVVTLPVPIALDRFTRRFEPAPSARRFLHIVGRPAVHDRNGTADLLAALTHVRSQITVTIRCQDPLYLPKLLPRYRIPDHVHVDVASGDLENYWDAYSGHDVLVMPRRFGGLCLPAQEALGAGMPVIMPDIAPNELLCDRAWLVPATRTGEFRARSMIDLHTVDHRALAARIDEFASNTNVFATAREAARWRGQQRSWEALSSDYDRVFDGLLAPA